METKRSFAETPTHPPTPQGSGGNSAGHVAEEYKRARQFLDLAGVVMVALDTRRRITMVNKRACDLLGYATSELIGQDWFKLFVPEPDRAAALAAFNAIVAGTGDDLQHENTLITRQGTQRRMCWINAPIRNDSGECIGILASGEDVTEYRQLLTASAESQERLRILFDYAPDGCYVIDDSGRFADGNLAAERMAGCSRDQIIGKTLAEAALVSPEELPLAERLLAQAYHMPIGPTEFRLRRKDGSGSLPIEIRSYPVDILGRHHVLAIARDISERKDSQLRLLDIFKTTIGAMSRTIETRDPYTAGHQQRVAQLAAGIGREMGLDPHCIEGIHFGALIHDIGKIYVPAELLNRPGRLNAAEFALIKTHAEVGYNIVQGVDFPWPVAEMILQHHERVDGSGYPAGIRGHEIILEAKIIAVADVVEAMSSHRPYRPGLGMDAALAEIEAGKAARYEPEVVEACVTLIRDRHFGFEDSDTG